MHRSTRVPLTRTQRLRNADLSWSQSAGAQTYDVHFGTENPPPVYRTGLTSPSLRLRKLSAGTTYYWMVFAVSQGVSSDSIRGLSK